jgi:hypothetical protein
MLRFLLFRFLGFRTRNRPTTRPAQPRLRRNEANDLSQGQASTVVADNFTPLGASTDGASRGQRRVAGALDVAGLMQDLSDPAVQMQAIAACAFQRTQLLNRAEARLLPLLEASTRNHGDGHRLLAQVSLGELIRTVKEIGSDIERRRGYASINSKRVDFVIIDRFGFAVAVIEYQGSGHHGSKHTFMRDAVKREALRKAGVPVLEIADGYGQDEVRERIRQLLRPEQFEPPRG